MPDSKKDFFISYTKADREWAEWIAKQLEEAQFSTIIQAWDFRPGSNFVVEMDNAMEEAKCTITVLSPDYLSTIYTQPEWTSAFRRDTTSRQGNLLPVHVRECRSKLRGLLEPIIYIDLVGLDELTAHETLLKGVQRGRSKPQTVPTFPGKVQHADTEQPRFPGIIQLIWNVPYRRNPFFTGREDILKLLHDKLRADKTAALTQPHAISGLGGIGKTQSAIEYAYRYCDYYEAILWTNAYSREALTTDFVSIAELLNLLEKDARDQRHVVTAVKRWLQTHTGWLLILDNADDLPMVSDFIPSTSRGHILLTTRAQVMSGMAQRIEIEKMEPEEAALFLLRRAHIIKQDATLDSASIDDRGKAKEISQIVDGLPLALDQAGAYIEETACGLSGYLNLYQMRRSKLLQRRGRLTSSHPEPVATTWTLSFEKVEQANPAAAELLRLSAFLHPDAIPEEIITEGASDLGPILQSVAADADDLSTAIKELCKFSLVRRDLDTKTLTIHRLVQAVLLDGMSKNIQRQWAERAVRAVNQTFPKVDFTTWPLCQRYLPHALACVGLIEQWEIECVEAARLLSQTGSYLYDRAQYEETEQMFQRALAIREKILGPEHLHVAASLNNLAMLYYAQGKYEQEESLLHRVLAIQEQQLGPEHPDTALSLNNLALLYRNQGQYEQAERLYQQALIIKQKALPADHLDTARTLHNLAGLAQAQGHYEQAERLYLQALAIYQKALPADHPDTATTLHALAGLAQAQGRYEQAERLYQQALIIKQKALPADHPEIATTLHALAGLAQAQGRYEQAERLYQQALAIREKVLGPEHPHVAFSLNNLAILYHNQGKYARAEPLYQQALSILEKVLGPEHPFVAQSLENYSDLLRKTKRKAEAAALETHAKAIRVKHTQENPL